MESKITLQRGTIKVERVGHSGTWVCEWQANDAPWHSAEVKARSITLAIGEMQKLIRENNW